MTTVSTEHDSGHRPSRRMLTSAAVAATGIVISAAVCSQVLVSESAEVYRKETTTILADDWPWLVATTPPPTPR